MMAAWGTVCNDDSDLKEGQVVCRELVDPNTLSALRSARLGEGNGHIWLDFVPCRGNERFIDYCQHRRWNTDKYRHSKDASVICLRKYESIHYENPS